MISTTGEGRWRVYSSDLDHQNHAPQAECYQARSNISSRKAALTPEAVEMTPLFVGFCFKLKATTETTDPGI